MNKNRVIILLTVVVLFIVLSIILVSRPSNVKVGFLENNYKNILEASFNYFDGAREKKINFNEGKTITIKYALEEKKGNLELQIKDNEGNLIASKKGTGEGELEFKVSKTQKYTIYILAEEAEGKYSVKWYEQ